MPRGVFLLVCRYRSFDAAPLEDMVTELTEGPEEEVLKPASLEDMVTELRELPEEEDSVHPVNSVTSFFLYLRYGE